MCKNLHEKCFTKNEVAKLLSVSKNNISMKLNTGKLKGFALGDEVVILQRDLLDYLVNNENRYIKAIEYLEEFFPTEDNDPMGYCPDCGLPLTERNFEFVDETNSNDDLSIN